MLHVFILIITVLLVHAIKAIRLYLALYGTNIRFIDYIRIYCISTPVSLIVPYKLGEAFRMYCYCRQTRSIARGIITILLDRFMDTLGLITVIIMTIIFGSRDISSVTVVLLFLILIIILAYILFPGLCRFWKRYLLGAKASARKIWALKVITSCDNVYREINEVTYGRGVILYIMSIMCWAIEISGLAIIIRTNDSRDIAIGISNYLDAAIGLGKSIEMNQFVMVSVGVLVVVFVLASIISVIQSRGEKRADSSYI